MSDYPVSWRAVTLGEAATWLSGGTPRTDEPSYWNGDIPWITSGSLTEWRLKQSDRRLTAEGVANGSRLVPAGTVIFVVRGMSLKTEFRIGIADRSLAFGQDCKALRAVAGLDDLYLAYAIKAQTTEILDLVDEAGHGTGRLNTDQIKAVRIGLPPIAEQRAIAGVLGALDDKIESNRRIVGKARELISLELLAAEQLAWQTLAVSSLAQFVNGGAYTKDATGTGRMVVRIAELNSGPGGSTIYNELDVPDDKLARAGDLLMSWSGSLGVYVWTRPEAIINQHIFKVVCTDYPAWLVYNRLVDVMPFFRQTAADKATTMGHIKRHHLDDAKVRVPTADELAVLDSYLRPIWDRMVLAEVEALELAALRDALLPELLSGRLRVRDVEDGLEVLA